MKIIKRVFDITLSIILICTFSPVAIIISFLIKLTMRDGPIIFSQQRVGEDGALFTIYKFRTMIINSQRNTISVRGDFRITPLGRFLRKTKLDELPELYNILIGDMSFVGPRPDVPGYMDELTGEDRKILTLKPGLTGPASLKYIDEEDILSKVENPTEYNNFIIFPDKVRINKLYLDNWSIILDLRIIFHTIIRKTYKEENYFKR